MELIRHDIKKKGSRNAWRQHAWVRSNMVVWSSRDGCKLRAKSWEMVRSRIGVKTEGALEIYCISARAPLVCLGFYLSHTKFE
jgi:hypothetical protein